MPFKPHLEKLDLSLSTASSPEPQHDSPCAPPGKNILAPSLLMTDHLRWYALAPGRKTWWFHFTSSYADWCKLADPGIFWVKQLHPIEFRVQLYTPGLACCVEVPAGSVCSSLFSPGGAGRHGLPTWAWRHMKNKWLYIKLTNRAVSRPTIKIMSPYSFHED